ncbi:MAG: hypothetical protein WCW78_00420 [Candidatus Paceibacterota bacterium]|jgi:hypothetical protein
MFKEYISYLKNNPENFWFKRKLYGWGWTPVTWQGWLVIAFFLGFVLWNSLDLEPNMGPIDANFYWFFGKIIAAIIVLLVICYKTGEKPRWQWGVKEEK